MIVPILFAITGLSLGVTLAYAMYPRAGVIHYLSTVVLGALAFAAALASPLASSLSAAALGGSLVVSTILSSGLAWARHPLLADLGYWSRLRSLLVGYRYLVGTTELVVENNFDGDPENENIRMNQSEER